MRCTIAATLLGCSTLAAADCGTRTVMSTTRDDGTKIGIVISDAQFSRAPSWSPEKGEPPLSIAQVIKVSLSWAKQTYKRFDSVQIQGISLSEVGCNPGERSWYYLVHFAPIMDGSRIFSGGYFAGVLMDGTVVGPVQIKNDF